MHKFGRIGFSKWLYQNVDRIVCDKYYSDFKCYSTNNARRERCELLVLGGGAGGCSIAAKFVPKLDKNAVIVLEPSDSHYYQPMLTLVGAGVKKVKDATRPMGKVLPSGAHWLKDSVVKFDPENNCVYTKGGTAVSYSYLVVALGLQLRFDLVKGLQEGLDDPGSGVCTNYSPLYAEKTFQVLKNFKKGNAVFTFPNTPVKCAGAPQKACYLSEDYLRKAGKRGDADVFYKTSLPVIFSVKRYAEKLLELCKRRNINVGFREELTEIDLIKKEATFRMLDNPEKTFKIPYAMLHVTPPMTAPPELRNATDIVDAAGFLDVDKNTLQHKKYSNVFGIGDCANLPTSKTAAAVAAQNKVLYDNLLSVMRGETPKSEYNGYSSCPLITGYGSCILAEFDYDLMPLETFPLDQSKESALMYYLKKDFMPPLYWFGMMKGKWNGPQSFRKLFHLGFGK